MISHQNISVTLTALVCSVTLFMAGCNDSGDVQPFDSGDIQAQTSETVLAHVDDSIIIQADFERELGRIKSMMEGSGLSPDQIKEMIPNYEAQVLEALIIRTLLAREYEKREIIISSEEVEAEIENITSDMPDNITLNDMLAQSGMTRKAFESEVKQRLKLSKLIDISDPTSEQSKSYYDENKELFELPETVSARHILVKVEDSDTDEEKSKKKEKAKTLRQDLVGGADFQKMAEAHSDCPSSGRGGALGNVRRGQMVPAFEDAAFNLQVGELSELIETRFGYHIIEVTEHTQETLIPFEEVDSRIKEMIKAEQLQEKAGLLIENLKEKATITYSEDAPKGVM